MNSTWSREPNRETLHFEIRLYSQKVENRLQKESKYVKMVKMKKEKEE